VLCDPSFAAALDHGPQAGAVDEADVHFAAHVRRPQALQLFEGHSSGQRFERYIVIGPTVKSARIHEKCCTNKSSTFIVS